MSHTPAQCGCRSGPAMLLLRHAFGRLELGIDGFFDAALLPEVGIYLSLDHVLVGLLDDFTRLAVAGLGTAGRFVAVIRLHRRLLLAVVFAQVHRERAGAGLAHAFLAATAG